MPPVVLHEILYQRKCGSRPLGSSKKFSFKTDYSPSSWIILTCFINDRQRCLIIISIVRSMSQVERCRPGTWKVFTLFRCGLASGDEHRFSFCRFPLRRKSRPEIICLLYTSPSPRDS